MMEENLSLSLSIIHYQLTHLRFIAPNQISRDAQADDEKSDQRLFGFFCHRAPDDPQMNQHEKYRHNRITPKPIRALELRSLEAKHDHRAHCESRKQRDHDTDVGKQRAPSVGENQQATP